MKRKVVSRKAVKNVKCLLLCRKSSDFEHAQTHFFCEFFRKNLSFQKSWEKVTIFLMSKIFKKSKVFMTNVGCDCSEYNSGRRKCNACIRCGLCPTVVAEGGPTASFNVDGRNGDVLCPRRYNDICNHFFGIRRNAQFAFLMSWDYCRKLLWPPHIGDITTRYYAYDLLKDVKINVYKNQIGKRTCHHLLFFNFFSGGCGEDHCHKHNRSQIYDQRRSRNGVGFKKCFV